jgi:NAD(P)H-hydrate epimerase
MRMKKANEMSVKLGIIIVLKGANTLIALPDGKLFFNSTGNSGMATAGAGDVLTGIISSLLAQGYLPEDAAIVGVYLHGLAADVALTEQSEESLMAGDIIDYLGRAFKEIASHSSK